MHSPWHALPGDPSLSHVAEGLQDRGRGGSHGLLHSARHSLVYEGAWRLRPRTTCPPGAGPVQI